jgi:hypothetical protein
LNQPGLVLVAGATAFASFLAAAGCRFGGLVAAGTFLFLRRAGREQKRTGGKSDGEDTDHNEKLVGTIRL